MWYQWMKFSSLPMPTACLPDFGGHEPRLTEVLRDPIIHRLMARDGVEMTTLVALIGRTQRRLQ